MSEQAIHHLGDYLESSREKGRDGLPTLSVTLNDGLVRRDELERRTETQLGADEHLLVETGDLAYNMMRIWQGAVGLAESDGIVSPAYVVVKPKPNVDSQFVFYLFKTPLMIYKFWAQSYGLTEDRLRLYPKDFLKIRHEMPPVKEQRKIAAILTTWDSAIEATERLLENSKKRKKALMQQLLTGKKRLRGFDGEWASHRLADMAEVLISPVDKKSVEGQPSVLLCNYMDVYKNDYITSDMAFMDATAPMAQVEKFQIKKNDVLITKDSEDAKDIAVPSLVDEELPGVICGYHLAILRPGSSLCGAYLNFLLQAPKVRHYFYTLSNGVTRFGLTIEGIRTAELVVPDVAEQSAIADILRAQDDQISALNRKVGTLKSEKKALMQQLLTGKKRVTVDRKAA